MFGLSPFGLPMMFGLLPFGLFWATRTFRLLPFGLPTAFGLLWIQEHLDYKDSWTIALWTTKTNSLTIFRPLIKMKWNGMVYCYFTWALAIK